MCLCIHPCVFLGAYMNVGASVCVCVCDGCGMCMCVHTCICAETRSWSPVSCSVTLHLTYLDQVFHLDTELTIWLIQLASLLREPSLCFPYVWGYRQTTLPTLHLCRLQGSEPQSSHLCGRYFYPLSRIPSLLLSVCFSKMSLFLETRTALTLGTGHPAFPLYYRRTCVDSQHFLTHLWGFCHCPCLCPCSLCLDSERRAKEAWVVVTESVLGAGLSCAHTSSCSSGQSILRYQSCSVNCACVWSMLTPERGV